MRRTLLAVLTAAVLLCPLGCGDDDPADDGAAIADTVDDAPNGDGATSAPRDLTGEGSSPALAMTVHDSGFDPDTVQASPGAQVAVTLESESDLEHTFTVDAAGVDQVLEPGATTDVEVVLPESGTVAFYCRFHRSVGMEGTFVVGEVESGTGDGASTTSAPAIGYGY